MKRLLPFMLMQIVFIAIYVNQAQTIDAPAIYKRVLPAIVMIAGENDATASYGTGFLVTQDGWIATNRHVVNMYHKNELAVIFEDKTVVPVLQIISSKNRDVDLAMVKIGISDRDPIPILEYGDAQVGEDVVVIGHPAGNVWAQTKGTVNRLGSPSTHDATIIQIDAASFHGGSGGPVINSRGLVVVVLFAGVEEAAGINYAMRASALREFLSMHRIAFSTTPLFNLNPEEKLIIQRHQLDVDRASLGSERERLASERRIQEEQHRNDLLRLELDWKELDRAKRESAELIAKADAIREGLDSRRRELDDREESLREREVSIRQRELSVERQKQGFERDKQQMGFVYPPHFAGRFQVSSANGHRVVNTIMPMLIYG